MNTYDVMSKSLQELFWLHGRIAVVTGGARGIGYAIAHRLSEAGATVVIGDLNEEMAKDAASRIEAQTKNRCIAFSLNVAETGSIKNLIEQTEAAFSRIDIWVNNAGIYPFMQALDITDSDYDRLMVINQRGTFIATREAAHSMIKNAVQGSIINIVSTAAVKTAGNSTHYVASKHAVAGLTKGFARELGAKGVRVLAIAPTLVQTPGVEELKSASEEVKAGLESFAKSLPLGRAAYPDDIARVVVFAASDMAIFMTGSTLFVDGGELTF